MAHGKVLSFAFALGFILGALPLPTAASPIGAGIGLVPHFQNVSSTTGLGAAAGVLPPSIIVSEENAGFLNGGKGAAWFDYNNDGWEDVLLGGYFHRELHRNNGDGTFTDVTNAVGLGGGLYTMSIITPDFNNDGWSDVAIGNWYGRLEIFLNNGDGTFQNVTRTWNVIVSGPTAGLSFGDLDGDGWGDLYVGSYYRRPNVLFRNLQGQGLQELAESAGVQDPSGYVFQTLMFDYDLDGDLDLYDACDFGPDALYRNEGNWTFTDMTAAAGLDHKGDGMGASIGDLNGDGYQDVYIGNFGADFWYIFDPATGTYTDKHAELNITNSGVAWGVEPQDFNNDGYLDLFVANGRVLPGNFGQQDLLFVNRGNNTFFEAGEEAGVQDYGANRGMAAADYDQDGQLDVWVSNVLAPSAMYRNEGSGNHWLQVELKGVVSIADAVGARVMVEAGGRTQTREVIMGSSYLSQDSRVQHFGLGALTSAQRVTIEWPTGVVQTFVNVSADQRLKVTEYEANTPTARAPAVLRDAGLEVEFNASASTDDTRIVAWNWTFGPPYSAVALSGPSPRHTFFEPANFTGALEVTDAFGNTGSTTFNISIRPVGHPLVDAGPDRQVPQGATVDFSATLRGGPSYEDYANMTFAWSVEGPNMTANFTGRNISTPFVLPGFFRASVVATDAYGATGNDSLVISVGDNEAPVIVLNPPLTVSEDTPITLDASLSHDNDPAFGATGVFYWRLQGPLGQFEVHTGAAVTFTLKDPGPASFLLQVNDSGGNVATLPFTITAIDATPPVAEGGGDRLALAGSTVTLDALASTDNDPLFRQAGTFEWILTGPDGTSRAFGITALAPLTNPGVTHVRLHVVDPSGNEGLFEDEFNITALDRTLPSIEPMGDLDVTFGEELSFVPGALADNDPAFPGNAHFAWVLVDGFGSRSFTTQKVSYTFASVGIWPVTLTVRDAGGNSASRSFNVSVVDRTAPLLAAEVVGSALVGEAISLNAENSTDNVGILTVEWTILGPATSRSVNGRFVPWTFSTAGNYTITLTLVDRAGNMAARTFNITVTSSEAPPPPPRPVDGEPTNATGTPPAGADLLVVGGLGAAVAAAAAFSLVYLRRRGRE